MCRAGTPGVRVSAMMDDNIFGGFFEEPFSTKEEWVPLRSDNANAAPGDRVVSLSAYQPLQAAAVFFVVSDPRRKPWRPIETPIASAEFEGGGRLSLLTRAKDWILSDPV